MKKHLRFLVFLLVVTSCIGCDRVTKDIAKEHLKDKAALSYFNDMLRLEYAENPGAAMSFGADWPDGLKLWVFGILPLVILLVLFVYAAINSASMRTLTLFALALVIAGGLGNIIDRVFYRAPVTDFLNLGINDLRTGIFNVADICVTAGVIAFLLLSLKKKIPTQETQFETINHQ